MRRAGRAALWAVIGALLLYIALDVYENGALDGSLYRALRPDALQSVPQTSGPRERGRP